MGAAASSGAVANFVELTNTAEPGVDNRLFSPAEFQQVLRSYAVLKHSGHNIPKNHEPHFLHDRTFGSFRAFFGTYQESVRYLENQAFYKKTRADGALRVLKSFVQAGLAFQSENCYYSFDRGEHEVKQAIEEDQDSKVECLHACATFCVRLREEGVDSSMNVDQMKMKAGQNNRAQTLEKAMFEVMFRSMFNIPEEDKASVALESMQNNSSAAGNHQHFVWSPTVWWVERQSPSLWTHAVPFPEQDGVLDRICSDIYRLTHHRWTVRNRLIDCLCSETEVALSQDKDLQDQVKSLAQEYEQSNKDLARYIWWRSTFVLFYKSFSVMMGAETMVIIHDFIVPGIVDDGDEANAARRIYDRKMRLQEQRAQKNIRESLRLTKRRVRANRQAVNLLIHIKSTRCAEEETIREATRARLNKPLPGNNSYELPRTHSTTETTPKVETPSRQESPTAKLPLPYKNASEVPPEQKKNVEARRSKNEAKDSNGVINKKDKPPKAELKKDATRPAIEIKKTTKKLNKEAERIKTLAREARTKGDVKELKLYQNQYRQIKRKLRSVAR